MDLKKKKVVEVGEKTFTFQPAGYRDGVYDCELVCPYAKYCEHLPDPRPEMKDEKSSFLNFCGSVGELEGLDGNYIPVDGTIEENFKDDEDVINQLIYKGLGMVNVTEIVDEVCSGFCDQYDETHSNCKSCNAGCILNKLLRNKKIIDKEGMETSTFNTTEEGILKEEECEN